MKKILGIVVLLLLWCGNLYANQYDDFFDMFNKCLIKENKYQDIYNQTKYKFCNLEFGEKIKFNTEIGNLVMWKTPRHDYVHDKKAEEEKSRLFEILIHDTVISRTPRHLEISIYTIEENNNKIEIFFDIKSLDIVGWQTQDIYLNTATTLLYSVKKNQKINYNLFKLPSQN